MPAFWPGPPSEVRLMQGQPIRAGLPHALAMLASHHDAPVVVTADLAGPLGIGGIPGYEGRIVNVGVAEQAMVGIACGIAGSGSRVVATSFASFVLRATEQLRNLLALDGFDVVVVGSHAGVATGPNGATHHAIEDIAIITALEAITVWSPATAEEAALVIRAAVKRGGPHYIRLSKLAPAVPLDTARLTPTVLRSSDSPDVVVVSHGIATSICDRAVDLHLERYKGAVRHVHLPRVWPVDEEGLTSVLADDARIVVVEDHGPVGGLYTILAQLSARLKMRPPMHACCVAALSGSDDGDILLAAAGLSPETVAFRIEAALRS